MSFPQPPGLIVVLGATATGKTSIAIKLAQEFNLPIISADSRQVYRHFDIGTAKPSQTEQAAIPHFLIDIAEPDQTLTLAEYQQQAQALIANFHDQGITPILVGGSGLYLKSVIAGMHIPRVAPQEELRAQLIALDQTYCYRLLEQLDPISAAKINIHDRIRTIRALEIFYVTGKPRSQLEYNDPPAYPICQIGMKAATIEQHRQWISNRVEWMLNQGWLDEIQQIQARYGDDLPLLKTLGYAEMSSYLADRLDLATAKQQTIIHTCQFAKRQRTWFRGTNNSFGKIHWLDSDSGDLAIANLADLIHNRENWQIHTDNN
ncbi:tRNA dimethylallyltransferase [Thalassoporum mexicanum PCC 7367]|uniref:tRNA (adenosine(37)-N6)-dimethylallyltransferase MiaA n=1 Tax=Thalassoporum mexicanum TaxID=3457544 RepID=UPI00029FB81D|nr:tRNA (adenosine(37)-N6)-dimethylallyltransferase MiaA [Pseudanabaena sp. PCC 7367]AFY70076.1 tRNA dimethylallyltransferase [Pseudanabaena sp. PCC 7367]